MRDFKFDIGDSVKTEINSTLRKKIITEHVIISRFRGQSQTGNLYLTDPPTGSNTGADEAWFNKSD